MVPSPPPLLPTPVFVIASTYCFIFILFSFFHFFFSPGVFRTVVRACVCKLYAPTHSALVTSTTVFIFMFLCVCLCVRQLIRDALIALRWQGEKNLKNMYKERETLIHTKKKEKQADKRLWSDMIQYKHELVNQFGHVTLRLEKIISWTIRLGYITYTKI